MGLGLIDSCLSRRQVMALRGLMDIMVIMGKRQSGRLPLFKEICGYDYWTIVVSERREICNKVNHCLAYLAKISCISGLYGKL